MIHYITQVVLFQLLFLIVYDLFLKKETFFNYNRVYLLCTSAMAFILPFVQVEAIRQSIPAEYRVQLPTVLLGTLTENSITATPILLDEVVLTQQILPWATIIVGLYVVGVGIALLLFVFKLRKLYRFKKTASLQQFKTHTLAVVPETDIAFSFLKTIFLGASLSEAQKEHILQHELIHIQQRHTLDLLFFELLRIVCWFNPLVYVFQSKIRTLHEYTADRLTASENRSEYYQNLLSEVFGTTHITFINTFYKSSLIKNRITMLQKTNSKKIFQLKYLLLVPVVCVMLVYTSCSETSDSKNEELELADYTYSLKAGSDMSPEIQVAHDTYENFLKENNESHVAWVSVEDKIFTYSIHHKDEKVPEKYSHELKYNFPDDSFYIVHMQLDDNEGGIPDSDNAKFKEVEILNKDTSDVPFAAMQKVPAYPGCLGSNEEVKECTSKLIQTFVGENFNVKLADNLELSGRQRISVQFKIDRLGNVVDVKARAPHHSLESEAVRVVSKLPRMTPGEEDGKPVNVLYALPIVFEINE